MSSLLSNVNSLSVCLRCGEKKKKKKVSRAPSVLSMKTVLEPFSYSEHHSPLHFFWHVTKHVTNLENPVKWIVKRAAPLETRSSGSVLVFYKVCEEWNRAEKPQWLGTATRTGSECGAPNTHLLYTNTEIAFLAHWPLLDGGKNGTDMPLNIR